jgi:hypothetical protein
MADDPLAGTQYYPGGPTKFVLDQEKGGGGGNPGPTGPAGPAGATGPTGAAGSGGSNLALIIALGDG